MLLNITLVNDALHFHRHIRNNSFLPSMTNILTKPRYFNIVIQGYKKTSFESSKECRLIPPNLITALLFYNMTPAFSANIKEIKSLNLFKTLLQLHNAMQDTQPVQLTFFRFTITKNTHFPQMPHLIKTSNFDSPLL